MHIFIPSRCCIVGCNTIPPFRWKPVFWRSMYLHCSCWREVRLRLVLGTLKGIWSLSTQEWMSYGPVLLLKSSTFPSQERHGTVRKLLFWEPLCTGSVKWEDGTIWGRCKCSVVSGGCDLGFWRQSPFPSWRNKRVFPTAFRCYLLRVWLMFWTFSIVLGLFIQPRFRDWFCPSREAAGGFSVGPSGESWSLSLSRLI